MICGNTLRYLDKPVAVSCHYCGRQDQGYISCPDGHFVCERCHNRDTMEVIEEIINTTTSTDPQQIAWQAMTLPNLPMLGCQHAFIAGGALMAALVNRESMGLEKEDIREVFQRTAKQAHGGYCGLTGICGIAPAIGACAAVYNGSRCGYGEEQRATMELVSGVVRAITNLTGPSCCKAYVRAALEVAVAFFNARYGSGLPVSSGTLCTHAALHPHGCRESRCPYFKAN
ncbi:hypothetical protein GF1_11100 [Desulfolithobacter dissulfuricans]|uniref:DUF5714 domain-containing protein n=1 Tax=Desulfolithobacter dissulfuricans TaxID=2795293 RepID=A0A915XHJ7_9BACT|nr:DUF5714 domain-containing protein [Desulfolithobacter dissulfuricans]BCO08734.1 hypothetical protein GF1_11100 [Desulfolithobacter dissulfuricans]